MEDTTAIESSGIRSEIVLRCIPAHEVVGTLETADSKSADYCDSEGPWAFSIGGSCQLDCQCANSVPGSRCVGLCLLCVPLYSFLPARLCDPDCQSLCPPCTPGARFNSSAHCVAVDPLFALPFGSASSCADQPRAF